MTEQEEIEKRAALVERLQEMSESELRAALAAFVDEACDSAVNQLASCIAEPSL